MDYLPEVTACEVSYVHIAYNRQQANILENPDICSHSHEKDFLRRIYTLILKTDKTISDSDTMTNVFYSAIIHLTGENDQFLEYVKKEFPDAERNRQCSEMLLWCAQLLIDFHKMHECSEYLTFALRLQLVVYDHIGHKPHETSANIIRTMVEFLRYIAHYKCKQTLFIECLNTFLRSYDFDEEYLEPALPEVFEAAHRLHFSFFHHCGEDFVLEDVLYREQAIIENLERFLILAKYGYEDKKYERCIDDYTWGILRMESLRLRDTFGFQNADVKSISNDSFRHIQVLYLYIEGCYPIELYDRALHILWQTIPDPFFTQKQFMSSFKQFGKVPEYLEVWEWYADIVLNDEEYEYSPRSLKHIARCAVRRGLAECGQLPFGVPSLEIPEALKRYLCLENSFSVSCD